MRWLVDKIHGIDNADKVDCATSLTGVAIAAEDQSSPLRGILIYFLWLI
jgi:hypothetical protein